MNSDAGYTLVRIVATNRFGYSDYVRYNVSIELIDTPDATSTLSCELYVLANDVFSLFHDDLALLISSEVTSASSTSYMRLSSYSGGMGMSSLLFLHL